MKFMLCTLAAAAIMVLATSAGHGASFASHVSGKKPAASHLAHPEPFKIGGPKGASNNGAARLPAAANVQRGAAAQGAAPAPGQNGGASGAGQKGGASWAGQKGSTPAAAQKGGTSAAAQNGGAPATPMRMAPAVNMTGARVSPPVPVRPGFHAGQSCISVQRILVHEQVYETFRDRLVEAARGLKMGDPKAEETFIGPMISEAEARRLEGWIRAAQQRRATPVRWEPLRDDARTDPAGVGAG
jgi:Aldehyde dehydrogenase family